jgi:hypothetical protein
LAGAHVLFQPQPAAGQIETGPESIGRTNDEGRYELRTIDEDRLGAVVGPHRIAVTIIEEERRNSGGGVDGGGVQRAVYKMPQRYRLGEDLTFDVPAEGTEKADLRLTSP